ncbi:MAG: hypothetical protein R3C53_09560 [Pirellulaceae bacterium]
MLGQIDSEVKRLIPRFENLEGVARYDISQRGMTRREPVRTDASHSVARSRNSKEFGTLPLPPPVTAPPSVKPPASRKS